MHNYPFANWIVLTNCRIWAEPDEKQSLFLQPSLLPPLAPPTLRSRCLPYMPHAHLGVISHSQWSQKALKNPSSLTLGFICPFGSASISLFPILQVVHLHAASTPLHHFSVYLSCGGLEHRQDLLKGQIQILTHRKRGGMIE